LSTLLHRSLVLTLRNYANTQKHNVKTSARATRPNNTFTVFSHRLACLFRI